ncbi:MAG: Gfo/Idh/MocA family oxidoreductase [Devosia sp.]
MTLRFGIVGCGKAAGSFAEAISAIPEATISVVCDADVTVATAFAARIGARVEPDAQSLVNASDVDAVYAALPHALLPKVVEQSLNAGKHMLAEKPLALSGAEARRLGALADNKKLKLGVFFVLRRAGTVQEARRIVQSGAIGTPRVMRLCTIVDKRLDYWGQSGHSNWRASRQLAGGGVIFMNSIHQLDTVRYVTGLEYVAATGIVATYRAPADVEDAGSATLLLNNGSIVSLTANAHSAGATDEETIEIDGDDGRLIIPDPFSAEPLRLYRRGDARWTDIPVDRPDSYALTVAEFIKAVKRDSSVTAGATDAAAVVDAVMWIYEAADELRGTRG